MSKREQSEARAQATDSNSGEDANAGAAPRKKRPAGNYGVERWAPKDGKVAPFHVYFYKARRMFLSTSRTFNCRAFSLRHTAFPARRRIFTITFSRPREHQIWELSGRDASCLVRAPHPVRGAACPLAAPPRPARTLPPPHILPYHGPLLSSPCECRSLEMCARHAPASGPSRATAR